MGGTPVRILLARHGETVFNVEGRWQGQSDSPLTERGKAQARELARALSDEPIVAVYSSDLGRAADTAAEVAHVHSLPVIADVRVREIDVGKWTGLGRPEIAAQWPDGLAAWASTPSRYRMPGGEDLAEAQARALAFFAERMPDHLGQTVVLITHGAIGQAILVEAMGLTVEHLWLKQRMDNTQISRLEWSTERGLELIEFSDVRHLEEVGSLRGWRTTDREQRA
ncbi:MAG: histidine phosphatase family protein [Chloroflexi bacterium]|nr:histidine phosphatase family protein [Chloroflexota bacterium]